MKILVTSGPTSEPIDGVRYITNFSSGRTGVAIVDKFVESGHEVVHLVGENSCRSSKDIRAKGFLSFADLDASLREVLGEESFDAVIHLAAVSDYSVSEVICDGKSYEKIGEGKLQSSESINVRLKKNFKILSCLSGYSCNPSLKVIGFKLTNTSDHEERHQAVLKVFNSGDVDLVVHNDLSEVDSESDSHRAKIYANGELVCAVNTKRELSENLERILREE